MEKGEQYSSQEKLILPSSNLEIRAVPSDELSVPRLVSLIHLAGVVSEVAWQSQY